MIPPTVRVFLATASVDMRKSFDSLAALTRDVLQENPTSGHLFVFLSRRRDKVKLLWWLGDGFAIYYRRLEKGTFRSPEGDEARIEIRAADLAMLLEGVDLVMTRRRKRYVLSEEK